MSNKKTVILTAVITFVVTVTVIVGGYFLHVSTLPIMMGIGATGDYSADMVKRAGKVIEEAYYEEVDTEELYKAALHGMMASLGDEYSWFVDEEAYEEIVNDLEGEYTGIGVHVTIDSEDGLITVVSAIEDTPAYGAGIKTGDKIIRINGTAVSLENYQEAVSMMRGSTESIGEEIKIDIRRAGEEKEEQIVLVRQKIILKTVKSKALPSGVGYIRITSFDEKTGVEFEEHLAKLQSEENIKGLVIDLRNNGGGTLTSLYSIANRILPEGLITYFEGRDGSRQDYSSDAESLDMPMAVLINGSSASASEVLAGALRDHEKATLVGEKSFGKGIVQTVLPFVRTPRGQTAIYITTSKYYTPNGECIHGKGIMPELEIKLPEEYKNLGFDEMTMEQDVQLKAAWSEVLRQIQ